jgi:hypothetical protein
MESAGSGVDAVQVIVVGFDRLKRRHVLEGLLLLNEIKLYAGTLRSLEDRFAWNVLPGPIPWEWRYLRLANGGHSAEIA